MRAIRSRRFRISPFARPCLSHHLSIVTRSHILIEPRGLSRSSFSAKHSRVSLLDLGETSLGLIEICTSSSLSPEHEQCFIPRHIRPVWIVSFALAIGAVGLLTLSVLLLVASQYVETATVEYGRLSGFVASKSIAQLSLRATCVCCII